MDELIKRGVEKIASDGLVEFLRTTDRYSRNRVKRIRRSPQYVRIKNQLSCRLNGYTAIADPYKIVSVSPAEIERYSSEFGKRESIGEIRCGGWDQQASCLNKNEKHQAVIQHFCNDIPWEKTGIINYLLERLEAEQRTSIDGCSSRTELKERYNKIDGLYRSIKRSGYQEEKHSSTDYVAVHIARDGEFLFAGSGNHRLAIAKILDLDEIPVWVRARHQKWQKIREEVYAADSIKDLDSRMKQYIGHPDLDDLI